MVTINYTYAGVARMSLQISNIYDATDIAVALLNCPGVMNITLQEDGFKPYPIHRDYRYIVLYTSGKKDGKKNFASITDAARFGEYETDFYQIHDMFENKIYRSEDVACLC